MNQVYCTNENKFIICSCTYIIRCFTYLNIINFIIIYFAYINIISYIIICFAYKYHKGSREDDKFEIIWMNMDDWKEERCRNKISERQDVKLYRTIYNNIDDRFLKYEIRFIGNDNEIDHNGC